MLTKTNVFKILKYTLLESGPCCVQLIYSLRNMMWGGLLLADFRFQAPLLQTLNDGYWPLFLVAVGLGGFWGLVFRRLWVSFAFAGANVFFYGFLSAEAWGVDAYITSMNFLFEMLVVCWLTFRIPYDRFGPN